MSVDANIVGSRHDLQAEVTPQGQLVTGNVAFSLPVAKTMGTDNTPVNFVAPKQNEFYVITEIILYANKSVGANDATVTLYEADDAVTSTQDLVIVSFEIPKNTSLVLTGLNWKVSAGKFLNGVTDDDDVFSVVSGYFVHGD